MPKVSQLYSQYNKLVEMQFYIFIFSGKDRLVYERCKRGCLDALVVHFWHVVLQPGSISSLGSNRRQKLDESGRMRHTKQHHVITFCTSCNIHSFAIMV